MHIYMYINIRIYMLSHVSNTSVALMSLTTKCRHGQPNNHQRVSHNDSLIQLNALGHQHLSCLNVCEGMRVLRFNHKLATSILHSSDELIIVVRRHLKPEEKIRGDALK